MPDRTKGDRLIGTADCPACEKEVPVKIKASGKLAMPCSWCDLPLYANERTKAFELLMKRVRPIETEAGAGGEAPCPPPQADPPAPAEAEANDRSPPPPRSKFTGPIFGGRR